MRFWDELNTPSDFNTDWYGELTNQMSHTALGALVALVFVSIYGVLFQDMPYRGVTLAAIFIGYGAVIEYKVQGWLKGDSWFDCTMVTFGAAMLLMPLSYFQTLDSVILLSFNPRVILLLVAGWAALLFVRVLKRYKVGDE